MSFERSHELWRPTDQVHDALVETGTPQHIVVSGPMGGGKSAVKEGVSNWIAPYDIYTHGQKRRFSVSWTSRSARPGEIDGVDYVFDVSPDTFEESVANGKLIEYVCHPGGWYGTPMPDATQPMLYEYEVTGLRQSLENRASLEIGFRRSLAALYIVQGSCRQLIEQILNRPDNMSEEKKLARASRYPGEILYIFRHHLPYSCIENIPGKQQQTVQKALQVVARDPDVELLSDRDLATRAEEACDTLVDYGVEPLLHLE